MLNPIEALIQKQVARLQEGVERAITELSETSLEARAGSDGAVVVARANGLGDLVALEIADGLLDGADRAEVQNLVLEAVRAVLQEARDLKRAKLAERTPLGSMGVELPDVF